MEYRVLGKLGLLPCNSEGVVPAIAIASACIVDGLLSTVDGRRLGLLSAGGGRGEGLLSAVEERRLGLLSAGGWRGEGLLSAVGGRRDREGLLSVVDRRGLEVLSAGGGRGEGLLSTVDGRGEGLGVGWSILSSRCRSLRCFLQ